MKKSSLKLLELHSHLQLQEFLCLKPCTNNNSPCNLVTITTLLGKATFAPLGTLHCTDLTVSHTLNGFTDFCRILRYNSLLIEKLLLQFKETFLDLDHNVGAKLRAPPFITNPPHPLGWTVPPSSKLFLL